MKKLSDLPNISTVIEQKLTDAGIDTPLKLAELGAREAFIRIRLKDPTACINMLYGLQGAIEGIRWHNLPDAAKFDLKLFYSSLSGNKTEGKTC